MMARARSGRILADAHMRRIGRPIPGNNEKVTISGCWREEVSCVLKQATTSVDRFTLLIPNTKTAAATKEDKPLKAATTRRLVVQPNPFLLIGIDLIAFYIVNVDE